MRTILVVAVLAFAGCSDEQNLGDRPVLHAARWVVAAGAPDGDPAATMIAIDAAGDVLAGGPLQGTVDFGTTTLSGTGAGTYWLGKRSGIDGSEDWTLPMSGTDFGISALAVTSQREVVIAGTYTESHDFGGQMLLAQQSDAFVAKYDPDGHLMWVTGLDPRSQAGGNGLAVAADGQIYLTAQFTGTISFPDRIVSGGPYVVVALAPDGHVLWGRQLPVGGTVHVTSDGAAIVAGKVDASTSVGSTMIDLTRDPDLFVAKLDRDGTLASVHSFGTFGQADLGMAWTVDSNDRVAADVNGAELHTSAPDEMLLDDSGTPVWSASLVSGAGRALAIAATPDGLITSGQITSASIDPGNGVHVGVMYLTARDGSGALADARVFGDPSLGRADAITALAVGPSGELAFAGYLDQPVDFGSGRIVPPGGADHQSLVLGVLAP